MGKEEAPHDHMYDVTGALCENCDKFAVDRMLPEINTGDLLVIHDTGAQRWCWRPGRRGCRTPPRPALSGG